MVTQTIRVNLNQKDLETILAVQSDTLREIAFEFYATDAEDAEQLDPDDFTVKLNMLKPDNNFVMTTFTDGVIKLSDQMTAVTGTGYYCILLMQDDELIYSGNGKIIINDHVIGSENIDSVSEADGYIFPDDFYTKDTPLAVLDDSTTGTGSTWSSEKIAEEIASIPGADIIDDTVTSTEKTWSSSKISEEVAAAASEIDDSTTATDSTWSSEKISEEISAVTPTITKEVTGNPIEFSDGADAPLVKCMTQITGSQDLHGYDKPWVGGAGKNKYSGADKTVSRESVVTLDNDLPSGVWFFSAVIDCNNPEETLSIILRDANNTTLGTIYITHDSTTRTYGGVNVTAHIHSLILRSGSTYATAQGYTATYTDIMLESGEYSGSYAPYSNICPITAYTEGEIEVSDGDGNGTTHTTTYPSAIYRGSEDVVKGEVSYDMTTIDLGSLTWGRWGANLFYNSTIPTTNPDTSVGNDICSAYECYKYSDLSSVNYGFAHYVAGGVSYLLFKDIRFDYATDFKTAVTGQTLAYELATPTTSSVTPTNTPIKSLSGYNHIESSTGALDVEYIVDDYQPIIDCIPAGPLYSTNEQITGTWTDGRPVYTRIIPVNATWQNIGTTSRQSFVYLQDWAKEIDIITDLFIIGKDQYYGYTFNAAANLDRGIGSIEACWNDPFGGLLTSVPVECVRMSYVKTASVSRTLQRISEISEVRDLQDPVLEERREEEYEDELYDKKVFEPGTYDTNRE